MNLKIIFMKVFPGILELIKALSNILVVLKLKLYLVKIYISDISQIVQLLIGFK